MDESPSREADSLAAALEMSGVSPFITASKQHRDRFIPHIISVKSTTTLAVGP